MASTEQFRDLEVHTFSDDAAWEAWLDEHHATRTEGIWVQFAKKGNDTPSVARLDAVRTALCWGWIDGQLARSQPDWYLIRFTPRRARSIWSQVNVGHVADLTAQGRMQPSGIAQVEAAKADGRWDAAYASPSKMGVPAELQAALDASPRAAAAWATLKKNEQYAMCFRIANAKRAETKQRNAAKFVAELEARADADA